MLQPLMAQPETKVAIVAFDSQVHAIENFTGDQNAVERDLRSLQPGDGGAAILDAVNYSVQLLDGVPKDRKRVLLLISETRDHGSHSATIDDVIKAIGNSNMVVYTLAFSPSKSNMLDTLRGNNNPDLHPEQTEVHEEPDLLAPLVLAAQAMRKNTAKASPRSVAASTQMFDSAKGFDARMTDFANHLHSRYLLSFQPAQPHPGLHRLTRASQGARRRDRSGPQQLLGAGNAAVKGPAVRHLPFVCVSVVNFLLCARSTPPSASSLAMIFADHCATSSSRSVRSFDWNSAWSRTEYLPAPTFSPR